MMRGRPYRPDLKKEAGESASDKKHHSGTVPFRHRPTTRQLTVSTNTWLESHIPVLQPWFEAVSNIRNRLCQKYIF